MCAEQPKGTMTTRYYTADQVIAGWEECKRRPHLFIPCNRDEHDVTNVFPKGYERPGPMRRVKDDTPLRMYFHVQRYLRTYHQKELDRAKFDAWYETRPLQILRQVYDPPLHECVECEPLGLRVAFERWLGWERDVKTWRSAKADKALTWKAFQHAADRGQVVTWLHEGRRTTSMIEVELWARGRT